MMRRFFLFLFLGLFPVIKSMDTISDDNIAPTPTDYILKIVREASRKKWGTMFLHGYVFHRRIRQLALEKNLTDGYTKNCFVDGHKKRERLETVRTYITFFCSPGVKKQVLLLTYLQAKGKKNIAHLKQKLKAVADDQTNCFEISSHSPSNHEKARCTYTCTTLVTFDEFSQRITR